MDSEIQLKNRLEERSGGAPVIIQCLAIVQALKALDSRKVSLIHPPWFTNEMDQLGVEYYESQGFEVVSHGSAKLRSDYGEIIPEQLHAYALNHVPDIADSLVIGGGGFRAIGSIKALEQSLDRPVLSANQASMWAALNMAGITFSSASYGRIFMTGPN